MHVLYMILTVLHKLLQSPITYRSLRFVGVMGNSGGFCKPHILKPGCRGHAICSYPFTTQSRILTTLKMKPLENVVGKRRKCW